MIYGTSIWLRVFLAIGFFIFIVATLLNQSSHFYILYPLLGLSVFSFIALIESFTSRIIPLNSRLLIRSNFITREYERSFIKKVKWEGGNVFILSTEDKWIKVPDMGQNTQSIFNTIKAWHGCA